ncbi:MAG: crossover junction endodeoxyribonuclease RuvC [Patescibacteria group bacterium]
MIILGIDPGTSRIGYGVIEKSNGKLIYLDAGLINIPSTQKTEKLMALEKNLGDLIDKFKPDLIGVEKIFFSNNQKTAIAVAEARGVILNTIAKKSILLAEFTPPEVKKAVTDDGRASKQAVAKMVNLFLNLETRKILDDVTDALAIAIAASSRVIPQI